MARGEKGRPDWPMVVALALWAAGLVVALVFLIG
jgi:hypothetical protein